MKQIIKSEIYDSFKCSADQCPFTCCEDWEIAIGHETYAKWKGDAWISRNLTKTVRTKNKKHEAVYSIRMNEKRMCPYLSSEQLCSLVINQGEEFIPGTCRIFPRVINDGSELQELSLSCACPEVVDMLRDINNSVKHLDQSKALVESGDAFVTELRQAMIVVLQKPGYTLKHRLFLCFHMLLELQHNSGNQKSILDNYIQETQLDKANELWKYCEQGQTTELWVNTFLEVSELFLDIVQNYRRRRKYKEKLQALTDLAEELLEAQEEEALISYSKEYATQFQSSFEQYDKLLENCLVTKIFANCCSNSIDDTIMSFQIIITEYVMTKYSAFLKTKVTDNSVELYTILRDYIVVYSRIIEYNMDGMKEFWADSFGEASWEMGYLLLLLG